MSAYTRRLITLILLLTMALPLEAVFAEKCSDSDAKDPFEGAWVGSGVKMVLARRIANDPDHIKDSQFGECNPDLIAPYISPSWSDRNNALAKYPEGKALVTDDQSQLDDLFKNVANRIKLRLIK